MPHQAEANLVALIESTDDYIWSVDLDYRLITFNRAGQRDIETRFGTHLAMGMRPDQFLPPVFAAMWLALYERALKSGPFRMEYQFANARFVELSLSPIVVDGKTTGVSVFAKDITERKTAESALIEAEKKYRDIFDGALEGIFQTYPDGRLRTANPAIARLLGYESVDEFMSTVKNVATDICADPNECAAYLKLLEDHGTVLSFESRLKRKDGSIIWVSINGRRVFHPDGSVSHNEGFVVDITERKRAEAVLRESEESLREAQRIGKLGSYVLEPPAGAWTSSEVLDELLGISSDCDRTLAGWLALIHPDDRDTVAAYVREEVFGKRRDFDKEYRIIRPSDGVERWVHGIGRLDFDALGRPAKMRGVIKDITERKQVEIQLRDSETRYRETFEQAAVGIAHATFEGRFMRCNARFAEILGYPPEEIPGLTIQQITAPEDLAQSLASLQRMRAVETAYANWEKRCVRKDGSLTWVRITASVQRDSTGRPLHYIAVVEDINARKMAEDRLAAAQQALQVSEERYRTAFQTSLDAITISKVDDGLLIDCNRAFLDRSGYDRHEVIGRTARDLNLWVEPRDRDTLIEILRRNSSCRDMEVRFHKKNGESFWGQVSASLIEIDGELCVLLVTRDISDAKAAAEQIRNLAFYDSLTGLPNRRLLLDRLQQVLAAGAGHGHMHALLLIDLDHFKMLNDTLGHQAGNLLLQEVARRLVECVLEADMMARLVGDEFVVMLENLSETAEDAGKQAKSSAEKMLAAIAKPYLIGDRECRCSASIGITIFADGRDGADEVLQQADIAMDHAKADGGNRARFFSPALQTAVNARAAMEADLRRAIDANQFVLCYQPQVEGEHLIGVEALVRWNHPARGLLLPGEFIALAEQTGLILPLGDWVLETACKQIVAWAHRDQPAYVSVAVNISTRQFRQPDFVEKVLAALERSGAEPHNLELELTESMLADNIEEVIAKMTELKSHGLRFSLDDFGTGYSSLAYLKRLPLDLFKIDRSFVQDILMDASSGAIAQTIISLSQAMGLPVIAEGVETEAQRDFLARLGCHSFQGYLISHPLALEDFEQQWLGRKACDAPSPVEQVSEDAAVPKPSSIA
jgi:diguanylate cyclase (GGDEF)-like protein/PAS domain S-box-containing protein